MGGLPFSPESSAGAGAPAGGSAADWPFRDGGHACSLRGAGLARWRVSWSWWFRSAPPGRLDVVSLRVPGDEDHRHDKEREARDQPTKEAAS
jgi:hypothetical protein